MTFTCSPLPRISRISSRAVSIFGLKFEETGGPPKRNPAGSAAEKLFVYDATAEDPQGEKVVYVLLQGPDGMTIDSTTGIAQWTPPSSLRGQVIPVCIAASDGICGPKVDQSFSLGIGETPPLGGFMNFSSACKLM